METQDSLDISRLQRVALGLVCYGPAGFHWTDILISVGAGPIPAATRTACAIRE